MKYTVVWQKSAEADLATLWLESKGGEEIDRVSNDIDRLLKYQPESQGESRGEHRRVLFISEYVAMFDIYPEDRMVRVLSLWRGDE